MTNALSRYLETAALVYSWYLDDCWDEESVASKMIRRVNTMHRQNFCIMITYQFMVTYCQVHCREGQADWILRIV